MEEQQEFPFVETVDLTTFPLRLEKLVQKIQSLIGEQSVSIGYRVGTYDDKEWQLLCGGVQIASGPTFEKLLANLTSVLEESAQAVWHMQQGK